MGLTVFILLAGAIGCSKPPMPDPPPTTTPAPAPAPNNGAIEVTVEELIRQVTVDPNKYKKGTALQVTGRLELRASAGGRPGVVYLLEPEGADYSLRSGTFVIVIVEDDDWINETAPGYRVVIRGEYDGFYEVKTTNSSISARGPVLINPKLVSSSK